jgi:NAD(P)-dependent dehydrogenase (short-subunit alcohol dehydrogenase family)
MKLFSLEGEVAFVTGSGSGIGQRLSIGLAEAGAAVGCLDLDSSSGLQTTVEQIQQLGRRAIALIGDVTQLNDLHQAIRLLERDLGPLSVAINCAGIAHQIAAQDMPLAQWQRMLDVNLTGVFLSCQAEANVMLPRKAGSIVNIASIAGTMTIRELAQAHYNSAKAAVIHLSKSLAIEWSAQGVRVNSISPGFTRTPKNLHPNAEELGRHFERATPLGRMANVEELVGPAIFLSSQAASFCTGVNLPVDGGFGCC